MPCARDTARNRSGWKVESEDWPSVELTLTDALRLFDKLSEESADGEFIELAEQLTERLIRDFQTKLPLVFGRCLVGKEKKLTGEYATTKLAWRTTRNGHRSTAAAFALYLDLAHHLETQARKGMFFSGALIGLAASSAQLDQPQSMDALPVAVLMSTRAEETETLWEQHGLRVFPFTEAHPLDQFTERFKTCASDSAAQITDDASLDTIENLRQCLSPRTQVFRLSVQTTFEQLSEDTPQSCPNTLALARLWLRAAGITHHVVFPTPRTLMGRDRHPWGGVYLNLKTDENTSLTSLVPSVGLFALLVRALFFRAHMEDLRKADKLSLRKETLDKAIGQARRVGELVSQALVEADHLRYMADPYSGVLPSILAHAGRFVPQGNQAKRFYNMNWCHAWRCYGDTGSSECNIVDNLESFRLQVSTILLDVLGERLPDPGQSWEGEQATDRLERRLKQLNPVAKLGLLLPKLLRDVVLNKKWECPDTALKRQNCTMSCDAAFDVLKACTSDLERHHLTAPALAIWTTLRGGKLETSNLSDLDSRLARRGNWPNVRLLGHLEWLAAELRSPQPTTSFSISTLESSTTWKTTVMLPPNNERSEVATFLLEAIGLLRKIKDSYNPHERLLLPRRGGNTESDLRDLFRLAIEHGGSFDLNETQGSILTFEVKS